jgi:hypothetical protein
MNATDIWRAIPAVVDIADPFKADLVEPGPS